MARLLILWRERSPCGPAEAHVARGCSTGASLRGDLPALGVQSRTLCHSDEGDPVPAQREAVG